MLSSNIVCLHDSVQCKKFIFLSMDYISQPLTNARAFILSKKCSSIICRHNFVMFE